MVAYGRYLNGLLPDSEVNVSPDGVYGTYVSLTDSIDAFAASHALGVDASARLSKDESRGCVRACVAATNLMTETLAKCERKPFVLHSVFAEATEILKEAQGTSPFHLVLVVCSMVCFFFWL